MVLITSYKDINEEKNTMFWYFTNYDFDFKWLRE